MRTLLFLLAFSFLDTAVAQHPIQLSTENPHYFQFHGKPVLLISSGGNYGIPSRPDEDYITYFDSLAAYGMNITRLFSGTNIWLHDKELSAKNERAANIITPWARSSTPGYIGGGNKFDLDKWDNAYFTRLKKIIAEASRRGIITEFTLFGNHYADSVWMNSPMYPDNNIQGEGPSGTGSFKLFQTGRDKKLTARQDALVVKVVRELNAYDNLFFEICNEPHNEVTDTVGVSNWTIHMAELIRNTEATLPKKHLIASNEAVVENNAISVANFHYIHVVNMPDFNWLYNLNKVISMDETLILPRQEDINDMRVEAWDFLLRGGGVYNNLAYRFPRGHDSLGIARNELRVLQKFLSSFPFVRMSPDKIAATSPSGDATVRVLSEKGKQYAVYLHHSKLKQSTAIWGYDAIEKEFQDTMVFNIPAGRYLLKWIYPAGGNEIGKPEELHSTGKPIMRITPHFKTDIAVVILRQGKAASK